MRSLARDCGDFIVRRSDGLFGYQLAVVVDDALTGVDEVVRGRDILSATPRQIYLLRELGYPVPRYYHIPLLTDAQGRRLAKRDRDSGPERAVPALHPAAAAGHARACGGPAGGGPCGGSGGADRAV